MSYEQINFPLTINNKMDFYILADSIVTAYERYREIERLIELETDNEAKMILAKEYMKIGNIYNFS